MIAAVLEPPLWIELSAVSVRCSLRGVGST